MEFRKTILLLATLLALGGAHPARCQGPGVQVEWVKMVTGPEKNHFFGYYGVNVWNASRTHILALEADFNDRLPDTGERAVIGLVEIATGGFTPLTQTNAWNLQQGCMLFWNPLNPDTQFYFNDIVDQRLVSVLYDIPSGRRTVIPSTISGLSHDGRYALSMNYGRISRLRKVVSYSGTEDPNPTVAHPDDDGVFILDLLSGQSRLLVSYGQMARDIAPYKPEVADRHMWVEHAEFSRSDSRVLFLPRTVDSTGVKLETGLYTIAADGTDMRCCLPYGSGVSHFGWQDDSHIVVTCNPSGPHRSHVLADAATGEFTPLAGLRWDGHCSFDATRQWVLTDGSKDTDAVTNSVWMYNMPTATLHKVHTFQMVHQRYLSGDARCDLHPRISPEGDMICADAVDPQTGRRQIFIIKIKLT